MSRKPNLITCIYCKEAKPSSKEHAMQRSMGGNLTIPVVCQKCNNGFSNIDQALAERSLLSLIRVVEQVTDAQNLDLGGTHFWTPPGEETLEIQVGHQLKAKPKPQLMFENLGEKMNMKSCVESASEYALFIQVIREWIIAGKVDKIPILPPPPNQPGYTLPRLVLHKGRDLFFRSPMNFPEPQKFFEGVVGFLKSNIEKLDEGLRQSLTEAPVRSEETPQIVVTTSIKLNDVYRAIAKIAFNLLAAKEGADFVLQSAFDSIRDYIRGLDVKELQPGGPDDIAYDPRFVQMVPAGQEPPFPRSAQNTHTGLLIYSYPTIFAGLDFYGQQYYVVKIGDLDLDRHILHVHSFNYVSKTNAPLTMHEIADQIQTGLAVESEVE